MKTTNEPQGVKAMQTCTHAMFQVGGNPLDLTEVPLTDVAAFAATHPCASVRKVRWADGSWSWGKSWWHNIPGMPLARIGAGAYGDLTVWESPRP